MNQSAPHLQLSSLTRNELREIAPISTIVLPIGSIEQHGPHLPLVTDHMLAERIATSAVERASARMPVLIAPGLPFGSAHHHRFAGALSLSSGVLIKVLGDLLESIAMLGCRRIFIVNGHGGNSEAMRLAAKDAVLRHPVAVATCNYWEVASSPLEHFSKEVPGHAGDFETSLMLALLPSLVVDRERPNSAVTPRAIFAAPIAAGVNADMAGEWERIGGYTDPSNEATSERGSLMLESIVEGLVEALFAFHEGASVPSKGVNF